MNDSNGEKITRESLISYALEVSFQEYAPMIQGAFKAVAVIDPWEKEICFSDAMGDILGLAAGSFMYLSQFYQYFPADARAVLIAKYEAAIGELMERDTESVTLNHKIKGSGDEIYDLEISMKVETIDKSRFILALIKDVTPDMIQTAFSELFGPDIKSYLFVYDTRRDVCYLSDKFVNEFDLESNEMPRFTETYRNYVHPDDSELLHNAIMNYLQDRTYDVSLQVRFQAPGRGVIYLRTDGFSDYGSEGRFISGIFSDVTSFVNDDFMWDNMIDGLNAAIFNTDLNRNVTTISKKIQKVFPDFPLMVVGDFVETLVPYVVQTDRQRLRNILNRSIQEIGTRFAIEVRIRNQEDKASWVAIRGKSFENRNTLTRWVTGSILDLSAMNEVKDTFEKAGSSHQITGLPTAQRLSRDVGTVIRDGSVSCAAVIMFDINDFHEFTDRYGKDAGDKILRNLADLLNRDLPDRAKLYHVGTDNFAVLWPDSSQIKAGKYMKDAIAKSEEPFTIDGSKFFIHLIASAAFYPEGRTAEELLSQAEITLHKVKEDKNLRYAVFSPADRNELREKLDFQTTISENILNGFENFLLYYQPLTDAKTKTLKGAEALLRWIKPDGNPENPEKVVQALEATNQMEAVGKWILEESIRQCSEWIAKGASEDFFIHVNATADDLIAEDYTERLLGLLKKHHLSPKNIIIELTETSLMQNMALCRRNIELLHEHDIKTALDDFGSGYSSFNYLKELPVDEIKIDKTFVDDMLSNKFDNTFISAMTMLAHSIGKGVVVEGVETEEQYNMVKDMDADLIQGYYFGKPMSVFAFWNKYFI